MSGVVPSWSNPSPPGCTCNAGTSWHAMDCPASRPAVARQDQGTGDGERHPDSPLQWMQEVVDNRVRCSHCGQETPCSERVRLHSASPEHRVNCVPVGSCYLTCRPLDAGPVAPAAVPDRDTTLRALRDGLNDDGQRALLREAMAAALAAHQRKHERISAPWGDGSMFVGCTCGWRLTWPVDPGNPAPPPLVSFEEHRVSALLDGPLADLLRQATADRQALADLTEAVGRGDEVGLPEAYRAARAALRPGGEQ